MSIQSTISEDNLNSVVIPPTTWWLSVYHPNKCQITSALAGTTFSDCCLLTVLKICALSSDLGFPFSHSRTVCPPPAISLQLMSLLIHLFCLLASIFRLWSSPLSWLFLKQDKCYFTSSFLCALLLEALHVLTLYPLRIFNEDLLHAGLEGCPIA